MWGLDPCLEQTPVPGAPRCCADGKPHSELNQPDMWGGDRTQECHMLRNRFRGSRHMDLCISEVAAWVCHGRGTVPTEAHLYSQTTCLPGPDPPGLLSFVSIDITSPGPQCSDLGNEMKTAGQEDEACCGFHSCSSVGFPGTSRTKGRVQPAGVPGSHVEQGASFSPLDQSGLCSPCWLLALTGTRLLL